LDGYLRVAVLSSALGMSISLKGESPEYG